MELLCLTGVEDRLQADVRPTLELLRNAGIKVRARPGPGGPSWKRPPCRRGRGRRTPSSPPQSRPGPPPASRPSPRFVSLASRPPPCPSLPFLALLFPPPPRPSLPYIYPTRPPPPPFLALTLPYAVLPHHTLPFPHPCPSSPASTLPYPTLPFPIPPFRTLPLPWMSRPTWVSGSPVGQLRPGDFRGPGHPSGVSSGQPRPRRPRVPPRWGCPPSCHRASRSRPDMKARATRHCLVCSSCCRGGVPVSHTTRGCVALPAGPPCLFLPGLSPSYRGNWRVVALSVSFERGSF